MFILVWFEFLWVCFCYWYVYKLFDVVGILYLIIILKKVMSIFYKYNIIIGLGVIIC